MSFTSVSYVVFLLLVAAIWNMRTQLSPWFICACSFLFYAYWYPPYAILLLACATLSYIGGHKIASLEASRRLTATVVVVALLLMPLVTFKYVSFVAGLLGLSGQSDIREGSLMVSAVLPLGMSFYTFQAISYVLDVHSRRIQLCRHPRDYFTYLFFFPQLVAGPIVRATHFLPQLLSRRRLNAKDLRAALHHLSRRFFLKIAIPDNLAGSVGSAFEVRGDSLSMNDAWLGAAMFGIQIFCDCADYSEIAIGSARLLGFKLQRNFRNPYLATGVRDFWRRWHISLSSWFRDYLYIPMGGDRSSGIRRHANILVVFLLSGLWHGAGLQYILWGGLHGLWVLLEGCLIRALFRRRDHAAGLTRLIAIPATFTLVTVTWVPFRAADIEAAFAYWAAMFTADLEPATVVNEAAVVGLILFGLYQCWAVPALRRSVPAWMRAWDGMVQLSF